MEEQGLHELKTQMVKVEGKIDLILAIMEEREKKQEIQFDTQKEHTDKHTNEIQACWTAVHAMQSDMERVQQTARSHESEIAAVKSENKEQATVIHKMRDTLIRVSVISTITTAAITAAVIEVFGK
jgi:chromosome segregation ATPase